jgi:hypothetical protein
MRSGKVSSPCRIRKDVERRNRCAHVAQRYDAGATDEGRRAERFGIDHAVVGNVGFVEPPELRLVLGPGEAAAVDDDAADRVAMAADVLGQRVHDDVGTVFERPAEVGRGDRIVDDQGDAVPVRNFRQLLEIGDVAQRVADRFAVQGLGLLVDQLFEAGRIGVIGEAHFEPVLRQGMGEEVVGAAVQGRGRDDVVAGLADGQDGVGDCRLPGSDGQRADASFKGGNALLEDVLRRVHDPRVDVAGHLEIEKVGAMLRAVERIRGRLIDRHCDGLGRCFRAVAGVHGEGFEFHALPLWVGFFGVWTGQHLSTTD